MAAQAAQQPGAQNLTEASAKTQDRAEAKSRPAEGLVQAEHQQEYSAEQLQPAEEGLLAQQESAPAAAAEGAAPEEPKEAGGR